MNEHFDVPVALFVFNRPGFVRQVMEVLAEVRPRTLLVIGDGPRSSVPSDPDGCAESRRIATSPRWPCQVITHWSDTNLGCDRRLRTGLDWVFSTVDRAVINEDDIVADPSFFRWCERQLDRYADDHDIAMVSGYNLLGRWDPPAPADHLIVRRGSIHGWASWARAWNSVDHDLAVADHDDIDGHLASLDLDPIARDHNTLLARFARQRRLGAWDARWCLASLLADRWAVTSPVNLTANIGFGADATRTTNSADLRPATPVFRALQPIDGERPPPSHLYDRWSLLIELLATYQRPEITLRLARHRNLLRDRDGAPDEWALAHLVPLDHLEESISALRHLRAQGTMSGSLDHLLSVLEAQRHVGQST